MTEAWAIASAGWVTAVSAIAVAIIKRNGASKAILKHTLDCPNARTFAEAARELRESIATLNGRIDRLLERG